MLPPYVYDLIAAVQKYEDEHPKGDGVFCFEGALSQVPKQELDRGAAIAHYRREAARQEAGQQRERAAVDQLNAPSPGVNRHGRFRCDVKPMLTDADGVLDAAMERAVAYNHKYDLPPVTEFQLNPADAARFVVTNGYWSSKYADPGDPAICVTLDAGVEAGWLWITAGGKLRATPIDVPDEPQNPEG